MTVDTVRGCIFGISLVHPLSILGVKPEKMVLLKSAVVLLKPGVPVTPTLAPRTTITSDNGCKILCV
jgi:hypothetical protein